MWALKSAYGKFNFAYRSSMIFRRFCLSFLEAIPPQMVITLHSSFVFLIILLSLILCIWRSWFPIASFTNAFSESKFNRAAVIFYIINKVLQYLVAYETHVDLWKYSISFEKVTKSYFRSYMDFTEYVWLKLGYLEDARGSLRAL